MREVHHQPLAAVALQRVMHVLQRVRNHLLRRLLLAGARGEGVVERVAVGHLHHLVQRIYASAPPSAATGSESGKHLPHLLYGRGIRTNSPFSVVFTGDLASCGRSSGRCSQSRTVKTASFSICV